MPPLDPLLIGSFPVPPSHIPTSPNPPPSRPPSLPLPPVPGPSRISTTESFYLLSNPSTSTLSRSRSSSKVSESSSLDNARSSSSRPVSPASIRSGRAMTPHAGIEFLIQEHNARNDDLLNLDFELVGGPHDDVMDSEELLLHRTSPIHLRKAYHHRAANDSISSIDVSDILAATSNLSDSDEYHAHMATLTIPQGGQTLSRKQSTIARHRANSGLSLADPIDPSTLPASTPTKLTFPSTSPPTSPISPTSTTPLRIKKNHQTKDVPQKLPTPPSSPDIPSILASSTKTRPSNQRTRVESNASTSSLGYSQRARSKSRQRERTTSGGSSKSNASSSAYGGISTAYGKDTNTSGPGNQRQAHGGPMTVPRRMKGSSSGMSAKSISYSESRVLEDRRSWIPHDEFGRPIPIPLMESPVPVSRPQSGESSWTGVDSRIEIAIERLEEAEKGEESGSDDSSIDLHTPLPHYMLKHGLLSPKSKLLQEFAEPSKSRNGRESVMSASSTKTGYSNLHDPRNTEKRRIRHRDGKLLKGGIGLTTGLGWSDSEDEDAPSALTRRLSTINLSRSTSFASLHSMRSTGSLQSSRSYYGKPSKKHLHNISSYSQSSSISASSHPALSKSFSAGMIYDAMEHDPMPPSLDELDEWGVIDAARFSNTTSNSLTPQADTFGLTPSPSAPAALSSFSTSISGGNFPKSLTMPNINSKLKMGSGMQRPNFNRKRSGSGSRLSTSTVGSVNSNTSAQSGISASTSFSGFSGSRGIPEEEDELMMKTTTSVGMGPPSSPTQSKFRAQTMGGRKGYKYSKTPSGGGGSISSAVAVQAEKISHSNSTSTSGSNGLSSSPSTSSSRSIPLPVTPSDDAMFDEAATVNSSSSTTLPGVGLQIPAPNKDKVLPPLPPTLRRIPGKKELNLDASDTFMSTPVSGSKMAEFGYGGSDRKDESVRSTITPKGLGVSGSLNSRTRAGSNTSSASSGIATPAGRKTPTGIRSPGAQSSLPSAMTTPRPLRLASSPNVNTTPTPSNHGGSRDRAPVPVPSIQSATVPAASSGLPKPAPSPALRSTTPSSAPAGSTSFRSRLNSSSVTPSTPGSPVPSALTPGERKPRTGTGMVYRTSSVGPSKLRLPAVAAANGNLGASGSGIARPARSTGPVAF